MSFRLSPTQFRLKYRRRSSQLDEMPRPAEGSGESSEQKTNSYSYSIQTSSVSFASKDMGLITATGASNSLFYAYARRTDHDKFSRYILIFETADVADEWWSLVEQEYPDAAARNGPQLFTFSGDDFPAKPAASKQFAHLKTRWLYGQVGDATGTSGKPLDPIPLQDAKGFPLGGGGGGGGIGGVARIDMAELSTHLNRLQETIEENSSHMKGLADGQQENQGQIKALVQEREEEKDKTKELSEQSASQMKDLVEKLVESQIASQKKMDEMMEQNATQVRKLTEDYDAIIKRMESALEKNTTQIKELAENQTRIQQQQAEPAPPSKTNGNGAITQTLQSAIDQNASQIKQVSEGQGKLIAAFGDMLKEFKQQSKQQIIQPPPAPPSSSGASCQVHNVHPPPRKIGRTVVGYDYEPSPTKVTGASSTSPTSPVTPKRVSSLAKGMTQSEQPVTKMKTST